MSTIKDMQVSSPSDPTGMENFFDLISQVFKDEPRVKHLAHELSIQDTWAQLSVITGLTELEIAETLAPHFNMPIVSHLKLEQAAMLDFPADFVQRKCITPIRIIDQKLQIAIANPLDQDLLKQINFITRHSVQLLLCPPSLIEEALHDYYSNSLISNNNSGILIIQEGHPAATSQHAIVTLAHKLLCNSVDAHASDLHIQPYLGGGEARQRVDGLLKRVALLPQSVYEQLCRYFKAACSMDPTNDRITQDGRLSLNINNTEYELRISTLPAKGGERLVIRFLDQQREFSLADSKISTGEIQKLREMVVNPSGIILLTGPTGSGKTTTLYSLLGEIDSPEKNIITIENPVENVIPTISQVEVNEKSGLTFATTLRSVLRQDPDVILLGEIRDSETAKVATQAALTGHLVLSTVHTNDAVSAVTRLKDLGIKETVIADSLIGIVSQRLCRQLCNACKTSSPDTLLPEEDAFKSITKIKPAYRKVGCVKCDFTGFSGRFPITEILHVDNVNDREAIRTGQIHQFHNLSGKLNSFQSITASAARHIISGDTTVEEVTRVLGMKFWNQLATEYDQPIPEIASRMGSQLAKKKQNAILVLSSDVEATRISQSLDNQWFELISVSTSEQAKEKLKQIPEIVFVIVDIPSQMKDDQIIDFIHHARIDMAWSRLPAIILLPEDKADIEPVLREQGATSPCLLKPITSVALNSAVKNALSRNRIEVNQ